MTETNPRPNPPIEPEQHGDESLGWLSAILWPDGSTVLAPGGDASYWASPSQERPKILIPAGSGAAARAAVGRYHDGFTMSERFRSLAAEGLMLMKPVPKLALWSKRVGRVTSGTEAAGGLPEALSALTGVDDLHLAISLSHPKSNRKPVLQLLDGEGKTHGWAKVGWNTRTKALVGNEAEWLTRRPLPPLLMPRVLHDVELLGHRVVVTSSVAPRRRPARSRRSLPDLAALRAVTALGTLNTLPVKETGWWRSVETVMEYGDDRQQVAIGNVLDRTAALRLRVGAWHGDLTPWNLMTSPQGVQLIDWEFAADEAPMGFDLCHFHTQVAAELDGLDAKEALTASARLSPHGLGALGIEPEQRGAVWQLYLVELIRRRLALQADGYPIGNVTFGAAAIERLERIGGVVDRSSNQIPEEFPDKPRDKSEHR